MHHDRRIRILGLITLVAIITVFNFAPVPQDSAYHRFADQRLIAGLPNFYNVISTIPLMIVGLAGMYRVALGQTAGGLCALRSLYGVFFAGVFLSGIGSSYYHWQPNSQSLLWDRLPMTIGFVALFCVVVGEYISTRTARFILVPLLLLGLASVVYWQITELNGRGDLRPYALLQFLPMLLIPVILGGFSSRLDGNGYYWGMFAAYVSAKVAEYFDVELYDLVGVVSGHTLKHLLAAVAPYLFYRALRLRRRLGKQR